MCLHDNFILPLICWISCQSAKVLPSVVSCQRTSDRGDSHMAFWDPPWVTLSRARLGFQTCTRTHTPPPPCTLAISGVIFNACLMLLSPSRIWAPGEEKEFLFHCAPKPNTEKGTQYLWMEIKWQQPLLLKSQIVLRRTVPGHQNRLCFSFLYLTQPPKLLCKSIPCSCTINVTLFFPSSQSPAFFFNYS